MVYRCSFGDRTSERATVAWVRSRKKKRTIEETEGPGKSVDLSQSHSMAAGSRL